MRSAAAVVAAVEATGLLSDAVVGGGPVLLMCSAGRDSHCLLDVAVALRGAAGVRVLHVNHGLREGAAADAEQMAARCAALGVAMTVGVAGAGPTGNLHAWARGERARLAEAERLRVGATVIATAHTRSDLVETALGRFATQPGRRALLSMRAREDGLIRPLLGISRDETAAYCRERGITYRDDPSNADPRFARARLRHAVVPVLKALNPRAEEAIERTLAELADESAVLDALVDAELQPPHQGERAFLAAGTTQIARSPNLGPSIRLERLAELPAPLARLVLRELCERTLGAPCPRAATRLADVLALSAAASRAGIAALDAGDGARIEVRGGVVRCVSSQGPAEPHAP